jgi:Mor family transcriptional regulator
VGRPKNAKNVTPRERERIRKLYLAGVRIADIVRSTRRSESVVYRVVRGIMRKKPPPKLWNEERDAAILAMHEAGSSLREIGIEFEFPAAHVGWIVRKERRKRRG